MDASLNIPMSGNGSDVEIKWFPPKDWAPHFITVPLCTTVRFIQVAKTKRVQDWHTDENKPKHIDSPGGKTVYYLEGPRLAQPWTYVPWQPWAILQDAPNVNSTLYGMHIFRQTFETCAICANGCEKGTVYGCVIWGHDFKANKGTYYVLRWARNAGGGAETPFEEVSKSHGVHLDRAPGLSPTRSWKRLVTGQSAYE